MQLLAAEAANVQSARITMPAGLKCTTKGWSIICFGIPEILEDSPCLQGSDVIERKILPAYTLFLPYCTLVFGNLYSATRKNEFI